MGAKPTKSVKRSAKVERDRPTALASSLSVQARLGSAWYELDRAAARARLQGLVGTDLAYGLPQMPEERAAALTGRFFAEFAEGARFFTRMERHFMTDSVQEGALAVVDAAQVCIVLFTSDNPGR